MRSDLRPQKRKSVPFSNGVCLYLSPMIMARPSIPYADLLSHMPGQYGRQLYGIQAWDTSRKMEESSLSEMLSASSIVNVAVLITAGAAPLSTETNTGGTF